MLAEVLRVLRPGGRLVALQPNIRYLAAEYWDFYDHLLPLSHLSCREAFEKAGFAVETLVDRCAEPLAALAPGFPWPQAALDEVWRRIFWSGAHDVLVASSMAAYALW